MWDIKYSRELGSKGKAVPVLNQGTRHKDVWGSVGITNILTSALDGGEWSA
jgi:hypothetical protein